MNGAEKCQFFFLFLFINAGFLGFFFLFVNKMLPHASAQCAYVWEILPWACSIDEMPL